MKFTKFRAFLFLYVIRFLSKIFCIEVPPLVSVTALIEKENKMLFLKLSYIDGYGLPGGLVKEKETAEQALIRETSEETGLIVTTSSYLWSISSYHKGIPTISLVYKIEATGELKSSEEGELIWLEPTEEVMHNLAYESARLALKKYKSNR